MLTPPNVHPPPDIHYGAPKTWYCIPPQFGYQLEQVNTTPLRIS